MEVNGPGALLRVFREFIREEGSFAVVVYLFAFLIGLVLPAVEQNGA